MKTLSFQPLSATFYAWLLLWSALINSPAPAQLLPPPVRPILLLHCPPEDVIEECAGPEGTVVSFEVTASSVLGGTPTITCTPPSGSLFPLGITRVQCSAVNARGESASCSFNVVVRDTRPPVLTLPRPIAVECAAAAGAKVQWEAVATDACDGPVTVACVPPSGSLLPVGTTLVQCTAADSAGNVSSGSFPVMVTTECAPCLVLSCPPGIRATLGRDESHAVVHFEVTARDSCTGQPIDVTCEPPSGSSFPPGQTLVRCTARNGRESGECSFTVMVEDRVPPTLTIPRPLQVPCTLLTGPNGERGAHVNYRVEASDNSTDEPVVVCTPPSGAFFPLGTSAVTCLARDASGNVAQGQFTVTVYPGPKCDIPLVNPQPGAEPLQIGNWGFELGLINWTREGDAFDYQPNEGNVTPAERENKLRQQMAAEIGGDYWRRVEYHVGHKGTRWISTGHHANNQPGSIFEGQVEELTGTLRSAVFTVPGPWISFLIGGGNEPDKLRVEFYFEIATPGPGATTLHVDGRTLTHIYPVTGHGRELMRRVFLPVREYIGTRALVRIVDASTTGHLNVDDFRFHDDYPPDEVVELGGREYPAYVETGGYYYDWDAPVWGFADLHTHPMSHLGFGYKVMHGRPDGPIWEALGDCNPTHGGPDLFDNHGGDYTRELVIKMADDKGIDPHREGYHSDPWKTFRKWPVFTTISHQQMWHEWIRRAYDGGLRVMVALCVNNPLLAAGVKGEGPRDDLTVGDLQIKELKAFVARHDDFMEIAFDPVQLRDIVRRDKLAVIIGSELDDIGNLGTNPLVHSHSIDQPAREAVSKAIQHLYDQGLRYIFPVHLMDNKFGGTGVGSDMLNIANKFVNGFAFDLKPASSSDNINATLETLDFTAEVGLGLAAVSVGPLMFPLFESFGAILSHELGPVPPGSASLAGAFLPIGLIGLAPLVVTELVADGIPTSIFPLAGNYPSYPKSHHGHRNTRDLSPLGEFALREMMRLGMMIDMDHMSQDTADEAIRIAKDVPGGYPLNSGHNSFREINVERGENNRSPEQMNVLRELGGIMGVGYENAPTRPFAAAVPSPQFSSSKVKNNSAGTSRSFAQLYLYALEKLGRYGVAFGTDINGLIPGPGPRFGGQGSFALPDENHDDPDGPIVADRRDDEIKAQQNGVRYTPQHGRPITSAAFAGKAVDPDREFEPARTWKGYAYNKDQRDFFAALRIFYWRKDTLSDDQDEVENELKQIESGLVGAYDARRVKEYAFGLLKGMKNWEPGSDILSGDTGTREQLGKALCRARIFNEPVPPEIQSDGAKYARYKHHLTVWTDYMKIFGSNTPMKRCVTHTKEWDINFEGVAHYGLLPDFIQDLSNVGVNADNLSPLFQSAEHFAQMWTRCLKASYHFTPHIVPDTVQKLPSGPLAEVPQLKFTLSSGGEDYELEESENLFHPDGWRPASQVVVATNTFQRTVVVPVQGTGKFYRLRKRN